MQLAKFFLGALVTIGSASAQNAILNGGFEQPGLGARETIKYLSDGSTYISGWTIIDDGVGEQPFYGGLSLNDAVLNGEYGVVLNQGSGIRTTFRVEPGQFYELGVWVRPDDCKLCVTPAPLRVTISDTRYRLPLVSGWSHQTVEFYATNSINTLILENTSSTADYKRYTIDDVSVTKVPGAVLAARLQPVITIQGSIGAKYEIQAAPAIDSPNWMVLTNLILSNSPTFYLDTNVFSATNKIRVYRAVRLPNDMVETN